MEKSTILESKIITIGKRQISLITFLKSLTLAMHVAGAIGLSLPITRELFQFLTPFNLLLVALLLVWLQPQKNSPFWVFVGLASCIGFASEVMGVATGFPFGEYWYGKTLGVKLWEVPLTIALNWLVLAYACGAVVLRIPISRWLQIPLAAALMVALDIIIEPVAIRYDFWSWQLGHPPMANYIGWFGVALIIQSCFILLPFKKTHPLAQHFFIIQATFFTLCLILGKLIQTIG